jgi:hypothetical protein
VNSQVKLVCGELRYPFGCEARLAQESGDRSRRQLDLVRRCCPWINRVSSQCELHSLVMLGTVAHGRTYEAETN